MQFDENLNGSTKLSFYWRQQHTNQIAAPDGLPSPSPQRAPLVSGNQFILNVDLHRFAAHPMVHLWREFLSFPQSRQFAGLGAVDYDAVRTNWELVGGANQSPAYFRSCLSL